MLPSPKAGPGEAVLITQLLRPWSYFCISFPCIMAIYILQQSTSVSKTQTRNNNTSPGASQKPQPRGGFGNQLLKTSGSLGRVGEFSATLDNKWTWWGPHSAVIPAGLHIESCIQREEPISGGIVAMNTEGIAEWMTASLPSASDSLLLPSVSSSGRHTEAKVQMEHWIQAGGKDGSAEGEPAPRKEIRRDMESKICKKILWSQHSQALD